MTDYTARIDAARLLDKLGAYLGSLGRQFSSPRFTDRHGDGPVCLNYEKQASVMACRLRAALMEENGYGCIRTHHHDENGCTETEMGCGPLGCGWPAARLADDPESHDAGAPPDGRCFVHGLIECPPDCAGPNKSVN